MRSAHTGQRQAPVSSTSQLAQRSAPSQFPVPKCRAIPSFPGGFSPLTARFPKMSQMQRSPEKRETPTAFAPLRTTPNIITRPDKELSSSTLRTTKLKGPPDQRSPDTSLVYRPRRTRSNPTRCSFFFGCRVGAQRLPPTTSPDQEVAPRGTEPTCTVKAL